MALPNSGPLSLSTIAGDLDLSNSNANLNDRLLRCRSQKYTGAHSVSDFYGRQSSIMDTMSTDWFTPANGPRWKNYRSYYAPNPANEKDYRCQMMGTVGAGGYIDLMSQHYAQGSGDVGVQAALLAHVQSDSRQFKVYWDQYQGWGNVPSQYYTNIQIIGWSSGWQDGGVLYLYNPTIPGVGGNGYTSNQTPTFFSSFNYPYIEIIFQCIVKSAAANDEYHEVQISNVRMVEV